MNKQISMKEGSVLYAARYIAEHNHYLKHMTFKELEEDIKDTVGRVYQKAMETWEWNCMSTGGWTVMFSAHDDTYGTIQILVDPAVSKDTNFVYI